MRNKHLKIKCENQISKYLKKILKSIFMTCINSKGFLNQDT